MFSRMVNSYEHVCLVEKWKHLKLIFILRVACMDKYFLQLDNSLGTRNCVDSWLRQPGKASVARDSSLTGWTIVTTAAAPCNTMHIPRAPGVDVPLLELLPPVHRRTLIQANSKTCETPLPLSSCKDMTPYDSVWLKIIVHTGWTTWRCNNLDTWLD